MTTSTLPGRDATSAAILIFVTMLAALGWVFSLMALRGFPPLFFIGVRFVLAGLVLGIPALPRLRRMSRGECLRSATTGLFLGLSMVSWIEGLHVTDNMGVGAFVGSLGNLFAPILGFALFRWRVNGATLAALGVAALGMACLSLSRGFSLSLSDLYFLGSALASSFTLALNARFASRIPIVPMTAIQLFVVGAVGLVFAAGEAAPGMPDAAALGWLAASVLIATSLRFALQVKGQSLAPVSQAALILTLEPVWTALISVIWLGTAMTGVQAVGCGLIFLALLVNRWEHLRAMFSRVAGG